MFFMNEGKGVISSGQPAQRPVPGQSAASEHLRILSRPDWVEPVVMFLKEKALTAGVCDTVTADRLIVALTEAITNAIVHGNYELSSELKNRGDGSFKKELDARITHPDYTGRVVDIRVEYHADRCTWVIRDQGQGFDFRKALKRTESDDPMELLAAGRGITIMRAFVDEIDWAEDGREVHLALRFDKGIEQRKHRRIPYSASIAITTNPVDPPHVAIARNLSVSGIACVMDHALPLGSRVQVTLNVIDPDSAIMPGSIVRCRPINNPYFDLGIQFDDPETE